VIVDVVVMLIDVVEVDDGVVIRLVERDIIPARKVPQGPIEEK
jgi:hypothetical protein